MNDIKDPSGLDPALWTDRLSALARLVRADAVAVVSLVEDRLRPVGSWGLPAGDDAEWLKGPGGATALAAFQQRSIQHRPGI